MGSGLQGPLAVAGLRLWLAPGVPAGLARELARDALHHLAASPAAKRGRRKAFYTDLRKDGRAYLLKVNRYPRGSWPRRRSKARLELERAVAIAERGIPTVVPTAVAEQRTGRRLEACWLWIPREPDAVDLAAHWADLSISHRQRAQWAVAWGRLAAQMHDAGVRQEDFAPNNFLATPGRILAIDFERARLGRPLRLEQRLAALAKLHRYLADASRPLCFHFVLGYCGGSSPAARELWRGVEGELPRLLARDVAHLFRRAGRSGRRFSVQDLGGARPGWRCIARHGFSIETAASLLREYDLAALPFAVGTTRAWGRYWLRPLGALRPREQRETWATVQALAQRRGLCPIPWALLHRDRASVLVFERAPGAELASDGDAVAVRLLRRRLHALGLDPGRIPLDAIVLNPTGVRGPRAQLLAPPAAGRRAGLRYM